MIKVLDLQRFLRFLDDARAKILVTEEKQLKKLEVLGKEIGLSGKEVSAAYNPPLDMALWRSRLTPFTACVMILAVIIVSFLLFALPAIYNPPSTSTYAWGSRYGTVKPQDFNQSDSQPWK